MSRKKLKIEKDEDGILKKIFKPVSNKIYDLRVAVNKHRKPKQINARSSKYKQLIFYCGFMALPIIQLIIFYFVVNFNSIMLAFKSYDTETGEFVWSGLSNFRNIFSNLSMPGDPLRVSVRNSIVIWAVGMLVGTTLALLFSYYIYKKQFASEFFRVVLFLPSIVSMTAMVLMYKYFMENFVPVFAEKLFHVEMKGLIGNPDTIFFSIVFFGIWTGFGTNVLMYVSAMTRIPVEITEYAQIDGVSPLREFVSIIFPLIYSTVTAFLVIGITAIFTNQAYLYEFFENEPEPKLYTMGFYLFRFVLKQSGLNNYPYASAIGLLSTCIAVPLTMGFRYLLEKFDPATEA